MGLKFWHLLSVHLFFHCKMSQAPFSAGGGRCLNHWAVQIQASTASNCWDGDDDGLRRNHFLALGLLVVNRYDVRKQRENTISLQTHHSPSAVTSVSGMHSVVTFPRSVSSFQADATQADYASGLIYWSFHWCFESDVV